MHVHHVHVCADACRSCIGQQHCAVQRVCACARLIRTAYHMCFHGEGINACTYDSSDDLLALCQHLRPMQKRKHLCWLAQLLRLCVEATCHPQQRGNTKRLATVCTHARPGTRCYVYENVHPCIRQCTCALSARTSFASWCYSRSTRTLTFARKAKR